MTAYTVRSIGMAALPAVHLGSGSFNDAWEIAGPASVEAGVGTPLEPFNSQTTFRAYLFELDPRDVPWRIGACCTVTPSRYDAVNIFLHPAPTLRHGYRDADYPDSGTWPKLFRYMTILGAQLGITGTSQILLMPYFTLASLGDLGIFPANWEAIAKDVVRLIRQDITGNGDVTPLKDVVVSSYSYGITSSALFRGKAAGSLRPYMREVWDFDGYYSIPERPNAVALVPSADYGVKQYAQRAIAGHSVFQVPWERWPKFGLVAPLPSDRGDAVHTAIIHRLFTHACARSAVR